MNLKKAIALNSGIDFFGRIFQLIISSATVIILTRYLGPEGYGYYALILAFIGLFSDISGLGINLTIARQIPNQQSKAARIFANALSLKIFTSAIIFGTAIVVGILIYPDPVIQTGIILAGLSSFFLTIQGVYKPIYQIKLKIKNFVVADIISRVAGFGLLLFFVYAGYSLNYIIATLAVSSLINLALTDFFARKLIKVRWQINLDGWKKLIKEAFFIALVVILSGVMQKISIVLLSKLGTTEAVGFYELALRPIIIVHGLATLFSGFLYPILAKLVKTNTKRLRRIISQSNDFLIWGGLLLGSFFYFFDQQIILILGGSQFIESASIIKLFSIILILRFSTLVLSNLLIIENAEKTLSAIYAVGVVLVSVLSIILIPKTGAVGAAWSFLISELFVSLAILIANRETIVSTNYLKKYLKKIPLLVLVIIFYYFLNQFSFLQVDVFANFNIIVRMIILLLVLMVTMIPIVLRYKDEIIPANK
jgi:O-antigen/teichoic acid export membrane protein